MRVRHILCKGFRIGPPKEIAPGSQHLPFAIRGRQGAGAIQSGSRFGKQQYNEGFRSANHHDPFLQKLTQPVAFAARFPSHPGLPVRRNVLGPSAVGFIRNTLYVLNVAGCSHGFANQDSAVLRISNDGSWTSIANLSKFQKTHPVANPPADFEPGGTWYSMTIVGNLIFPMDANHGELDKVHTDGRIARVADISLVGHTVPTAVAFDGVSFYVGNLGIFPIVDGSQFIMQILPSGQMRTFATGFTTILALTFDSNNKLYVLENTTGGNGLPTPGTGKVLRLNPDGTRVEIATGLNLPTGMDIGPDGNIYVSAWGFGPPGMGEVDKITLP